MTEQESRMPLGVRRGATGAGRVGHAHPAPPLLDVGLAAVAAGGVVIEALLKDAEHVSPFAYVLVIGAAAPLMYRTVWPLATLMAMALGAVLCAAVLDASWAATGSVAVGLFTVALLGDRRRSLVVGVATAVLVIAAVLAIDGTIDAGALASRWTLVVVCVVAGELVRTRQELLIARRERAAQQDRERDEALLRAAAAERLAIARELHDSLGHFLVAINVRASVAVEVPETQDPTAALQDIKQVSASALRDLRSTLSVLREENDVAPTAPSDGLDALRALVNHASTAGVETTLNMRIEPYGVSAATSAAAIRIVQESLTNVLRHADAASADVRVQAGQEILEIEITDDGFATSSKDEGGFGLRGMTERAAALGGNLQAGPRPGGGWSVKARLPLDAAERS